MNTTPKFEGKRRKPLDAMRAVCVWCCGGAVREASLCPDTECSLYPYRGDTIPPGASRSLMKIIKARCLDCMPEGPANCDAYQPFEIHSPCPLWPFRLGRNPNYGIEQREKLRAHGKRTGFKTGSRPNSSPRINTKTVIGEMCGREIRACLIE